MIATVNSPTPYFFHIFFPLKNNRSLFILFYFIFVFVVKFSFFTYPLGFSFISPEATDYLKSVLKLDVFR